MKMDIRDALKHRRSYYKIGNISPISNHEIEDIMSFALNNIPSAFNSQSTRLVLLLGDNHKRLWSMIKGHLKKIVPEANFQKTEAKIDESFASGYGTILYYEDMDTIKSLQNSFPLYADNFPIWSEQTSAMHQLAIWTMLEENGFGASLQHYNNLIDDDIRKEWNLPNNWKLIAEMPFGNPLSEPNKKESKPIEERLQIFV